MTRHNTTPTQLTDDEREALRLTDDEQISAHEAMQEGEWQWFHWLYVRKFERILAARGNNTAHELRAAVEAALHEVTDPIHAGGCHYRHQQGETDECNSCAAHKVETAVLAALRAALSPAPTNED